jgi:hypothetical protein
VKIARLTLEQLEFAMDAALELMDDNTYVRLLELREMKLEDELALKYSDLEYAAESVRLAIKAMPKKTRESFWRVVDALPLPASPALQSFDLSDSSKSPSASSNSSVAAPQHQQL